MTTNPWTVAPTVLLSMVSLSACVLYDPSSAVPDAAADADAGVLAVPVVSASEVEVAEAGEATFTVSLSAPPRGPLTVTLTASDDARLEVEPGALTFTDADWALPRAVTVAARADDDADDDVLGVTVAAEDISALTEVTVAVDDDDTLGIAVLPSTTLRVHEGASTMIEIRLTARPTASLLVNGVPDDWQVATISPASLTFTPDDWATAQQMMITGVADADTTDDTTKLRLEADGLAPTGVEIEVVDPVVLEISPSTLDLGPLLEGTQERFAVVLTAPPPGSEMIVEVVSTDPDAASVSPATLTFSTTSWDVPQKVTVSALDDDDTLDQGLSVALGAIGLSPRKVAVQVIDDDGSASP